MWPYTFDQLPAVMQQVLMLFRQKQFPKVGPDDQGGVWGEPNAGIYWSETRNPAETGPLNEWDIFYATERFGNIIARANYNVARKEIITYYYGATLQAERHQIK